MTRLAGYGGAVYVASLLVDDCETLWTAGAGDHGVPSLETAIIKVGSGSAKCDIGAAAIDGDYLMYRQWAAVKDLADYGHILCWARSSAGAAAGDFVLVFDKGAGVPATPETELEFPVLVANTWKYCHLTAVVGKDLCDDALVIGLELNAGQATHRSEDIYLDEIRAAKTIAGIKSWTLDYVMNTVEGTGFDSSGHKIFLPTIDEWSGSFEGYKDGAPITIGSQVGIELAESTTGTTKMWRGMAIITAIHSASSVDGLVTYGYDFQGTDLLAIPTA